MLFELGYVCRTPGTYSLNMRELLACLHKHEIGDWGEVSEGDKKLNEESLKEGYRLMSAYTVNGTKIWIITEADRSVTTILLPEEY